MAIAFTRYQRVYTIKIIVMHTAQIQSPMITNHSKDWLESIPAGVVIINAEGQIDSYNKQAEELLELQHPLKSWSTVLNASVKQVINDGHYIVLHCGKCVVFKTQSLPDAKGQLVLLIDETDIYQSHVSTMEMQKLDSIEKLSASLAHQLRTPLSTAILYVSGMPKESKYQDKILKQLLLIKQQIDDVLMVCKGQEKLIENINLHDEVIKVIEDYKQLHPAIHIQFIHEKNIDKLQMLGHKASLMGALTNLLDNAIQASDKSNRIEINLLAVPNGLCIQIKDFGKGITPEDIERVKKPFYTTKKHGTGLGLSIAKSIVEAHQGKLEIASVTNQFTVVSLYLPCIY